MTGDWTQMGIARLAAQVRELNEAMEAVSGRLPPLGEAMTRLGEDVDRLLAERDETGAALARHDREMRALTALVKRLSAQVTWIERHLRSSGTARAVDLGAVDLELSALAATAEAGHRASDALLTPFARTGLETTVADHRDAQDDHRRSVSALLDACRRVGAVDLTGASQASQRWGWWGSSGSADDTTATAGGSALARARAEYLSARSARDDAVRRLEFLTLEARSAEESLAADDAERRRRVAAISAGERAEAELLTRLRTKLAAAVGDGELLPAWLTESLGPLPPAGAAQHWMEVAAGLLAYRITYKVTDPEDPLGELPETATGHRRRRYADLGRGVRELRR